MGAFLVSGLALLYDSANLINIWPERGSWNLGSRLCSVSGGVTVVMEPLGSFAAHSGESGGERE